MARPASGPGRLLERIGDDAPRGMTVHDRTRLTGRLRHLSTRSPRPRHAWSAVSASRSVPGEAWWRPSRPYRLRSVVAASSALRKIAVPQTGGRVHDGSPLRFWCRIAAGARLPVGRVWTRAGAGRVHHGTGHGRRHRRPRRCPRAAAARARAARILLHRRRAPPGVVLSGAAAGLPGHRSMKSLPA